MMAHTHIFLVFSLKCEGVWNAAAFRGPKMYFLGEQQPGCDLTSIVRRMRSIPRYQQNQLQVRHFGIDPRTNAGVVRSVRMAPTPGLEIHMTTQGRMLSNALNLKRKMTVSLVTPVAAAPGPDAREHELDLSR
jgi:hypothetical protein